MASGSHKIIKEVRPLLSLNQNEAHRRVIQLYKSWYRQIPYIVKHHDIEFNEEKCKVKLRQYFMRHQNITDIRVIDMLTIKGQKTLQELSEVWISKRGVTMLMEADLCKPEKCFMDNFLAGKD